MDKRRRRTWRHASGTVRSSSLISLLHRCDDAGPSSRMARAVPVPSAPGRAFFRTDCRGLRLAEATRARASWWDRPLPRACGTRAGCAASTLVGVLRLARLVTPRRTLSKPSRRGTRAACRRRRGGGTIGRPPHPPGGRPGDDASGRRRKRTDRRTRPHPCPPARPPILPLRLHALAGLGSTGPSTSPRTRTRREARILRTPGPLAMDRQRRRKSASQRSSSFCLFGST
jgi:hypothetical protein